MIKDKLVSCSQVTLQRTVEAPYRIDIHKELQNKRKVYLPHLQWKCFNDGFSSKSAF